MRTRRSLEVLLVTHHRGEIGGVERDWINVANALGPNKVRLTWVGIEGTHGLATHVDPYVLGDTVDVSLPLFSYLVHDNQYVRRSGWLWFKIIVDHLWRSLGAARQLGARLGRSPFDLVLSGTSVVTSGALFARARSLPHVWAVKEWLDPSLVCTRRFAAVIGKASASVIVPSRSVAEVFGGGAEVVPDGTDVGGLGHGVPDRIAAIRELGLPPERPLVVQCGTLSWWKGQHVTLEAVDSLARESPTPMFSLLFLGGGAPAQRESLCARVDRLPRQWREAVRFASFPAGDLRYIRAADVVIHPSVLPDPFPNAVREALLLGKAVVASGCGGPSEMIDDGRTGLLVAPGDVGALAAALVRLLSAEAFRTALGRAAQDEAGRTLSSKVTSDRLYEVLCSVVRDDLVH
jgi:glycosyltransferase involved in cell wall biosynthesis